MQIAMIGLGRMGLNMAQRLINDGHELLVYDKYAKVVNDSMQSMPDIKNLSLMLKPPRIAWLMLPQGEAVKNTITELKEHFTKGDIIIDGGNSHFAQASAHYHELKQQGINFVDVGVSGGIAGLDRGYCLMIGGDKAVFDHLVPIFQSLAPGEKAVPTIKNRKHPPSSTAHLGFVHCGQSGAGHYTKMIHNAIEYGLMQAYAEGFELLKTSNQLSIDMAEVAEVWRRGSVISSWLLDLITDSLYKDPELSAFSGSVADSGEGKWALIESLKQNTPVPNLANALFKRFRSRQNNPFGERLLSALRKEFGGHKEASNKVD